MLTTDLQDRGIAQQLRIGAATDPLPAVLGLRVHDALLTGRIELARHSSR